MKTFLTRKVRIFGRSVPLAIVALGVTTVVALGAWLIVVANIGGSVTSAGFGPFLINTASSGNPSCGVTKAGSTVTVSWSNATPSEVCPIQMNISNNGAISATLSLDQNGLDPAVALADISGGLVLAPAGSANYQFEISLDPNLSDPSTTYPIVMTLDASP